MQKIHMTNSTSSISENLASLIGNTDLLKIPSLSKLTGCEILLKCEHQNPGGSIKDRAALHMVQTAIDNGSLKPGMTIVEGTAGNTGIGLAVVAKSLGFDLLVVMPSGQTKEKEQMIEMHGATLKLVAPCPFSNENHFYHTARRIAEENDNFWWANQFENPANMQAHYCNTGPEIWQQTQGNIDILVSVAGTAGTIAGNSAYLKEQNDKIEVWAIDPDGSGIYSYLKSGKHVSEGGSFTEGIGIMRVVENFRLAKIDTAVNLSDQDLVAISRYIQQEDGIVTGSSTALNIAGALYAAIKRGPGKTIVTFSCDLGERSASKLYNKEFLAQRDIDLDNICIENLVTKYQEDDSFIEVDKS